MNTTWLAISNRDNWEIVRGSNIWGVASRHINTISKVKTGDFIIIYVSSKKIGDDTLPVIITGVFEVVSEMFKDNTPLFTTPKNNEEELYSLRIRLKPIIIFKEPILFKPLIPKLKFITNKKRWNGHIRGRALRIIPEEDYKLIIENGLVT